MVSEGTLAVGQVGGWWVGSPWEACPRRQHERTAVEQTATGRAYLVSEDDTRIVIQEMSVHCEDWKRV